MKNNKKRTLDGIRYDVYYSMFKSTNKPADDLAFLHDYNISYDVIIKVSDQLEGRLRNKIVPRLQMELELTHPAHHNKIHT